MERPEPINRRRQKTGRASVVGIVMLLLFGFFLFGQLTSPTPEAAPTVTVRTTTTTIPRPTTTTPPFDLTRVETGTPFEWSLEIDLEGGGWPIALLEFELSTLLFTATLNMAGGFEGMQTIRLSPDGTRVPIPGIDATYSVANVITTPFGLLAYGQDLDTGDGVVWLSIDGRTWEPTVVSKGVPNQGMAFDYGVASDGMILISGSVSTYSDPLDTPIREALRDHLGFEVDSYSLDFSLVGDRFVVVYGPLGVPVAVIPPEELGFSDEDLEQESTWDYKSFLWASADGSTWFERVDADPYQRWGGFVGLDGRIRSYTWGTRDDGSPVLEAIEMVDGELIIEETMTTSPMWQVHQGAGLILGSGNRGPVFSYDGIIWQDLNLGMLLSSRLDWWPTAAGVGESGIAFAVDATEWTSTPPTPGVAWTEGDLTISVDDHVITIRSAGGQHFFVERWQYRPGSQLRARFDPETQMLILVSPATGEDIFFIDAETVERIEQSIDNHWQGWESRHFQAFLFTTPERLATPVSAEKWTLQDLKSLAEGASVSHILVGSDRVFLTTSDGSTAKVWVGLIPDRE